MTNAMTTPLKLTDEEKARREHFFPMCLATDVVEKKNLNPEPAARDIEYSVFVFDNEASKSKSPFYTAEDVALALQAIRGGRWVIEGEYIGGLGTVMCAIDRNSHKSEVLWLDALGGWWLQTQPRRGEWVVAYAATHALSKWYGQLQELACGDDREYRAEYAG